MTRADHARGGALALAVMRPRPDAGVVADALARTTDPVVAAERLTFHGAWGHAHRVSGSLGLPLPPWLEEQGAGRRARTLEQHLRALHDLSALGDVLDRAGVPWLVFKGPVLSSLYPHADLRSYTDLDVLVPPDGLRGGVEALVAAGWPVRETQEDLHRRPPVGELHLQGPAGTPVDLHWHLFYRADHVSRSRLGTGSLVAARRHGRVGRTPAPTLTVGTHLAYVCAHAAAGGGNRLRWLTDVARLAEGAAPADWEEAVAAARAWGVPEGVAVVLWRAARHVAAPVPAWVVPALAARPRRLLCALTEAVDPVGTSREHGSAGAALARRSDGPLARAALERARALRPGRRSSARPAHEREDVTRTADGTRSLAGYLDAVEALPDPDRREVGAAGQ